MERLKREGVNRLIIVQAKLEKQSYIHLGSSVCHPVCRPVVVAER
jgi:hypothetical protein